MVRPDQSLQLGVERAGRAAAIPLQAALKAGARIFGGVDRQDRCPAASGWRRSRARRHILRDGLGHGLAEVHHVVGRQLREFVGRPRLQRIRLVARPVRALVVVVGAQEIVHALRRAVSCRRWPRVSNSTIDNACAAAAARRARDARDLRRAASPACPRYRTAATAARRTARSSARPSGTRRAAPARTRRRRGRRNHGRSRHRRGDSRTPRPAPAHRARGSAGGTA